MLERAQMLEAGVVPGTRRGPAGPAILSAGCGRGDAPTTVANVVRAAQAEAAHGTAAGLPPHLAPRVRAWRQQAARRALGGGAQGVKVVCRI